MVIMLLCSVVFFLIYNITWCMYNGDYGLYFGGVSFSSVYVPPPMFVSPIVLVVYIPVVFLFTFHSIFCIPISRYMLPQVLLFPIV